jgi:hypothetical protein|tara:strand:- start:14228 stop:14341 length:114 start_codon:yes stop_codon:yes gene_type:complete
MSSLPRTINANFFANLRTNGCNHGTTEIFDLYAMVAD